MEKSDKIYVAGDQGMVGSAIIRLLKSKGYDNIITATRAELDLTNQQHCSIFFNNIKPDYVFLCAAKVGGILANNTQRADFIYENTMITSNVIHSSYLTKVKKLLYLGSSCIYPKESKQPISETELLSGYLEPTNEPYALSKILGVKMCESYNRQYSTNFISVMPTNLYGYNDSYDKNNSHVFASLIRKFSEAKMMNHKNVTLWGTGEPEREFLFVDDLAEALYFLMENYNSNETINVGCGQDISIKDLAYKIKSIIGYKGDIVFDTSKPDGMKKKLLDVSKINNLGWKFKTDLESGINITLDDFEKNYQKYTNSYNYKSMNMKHLDNF